ncbi:hypothetical protein NCCP2716_19900 [Sporosarcina sp. NCCP-2716]|uniref:hypothetical protein n=1 Tax=Sporosarcina sp. NCCP-2716 TaxID=2943679 RepID=UPI00203E1AC1|nr:hypothetical protein [Sporosarcina sp. NCCP-2716]GKV69492.1 hypothetical protein NCCP2716_19900 [Sporosarcina sp. NCCP-2716]
MNAHIRKVGLFTGLTTLVLFIVGVRTISGHELDWKNYLAFSVFSLTVGLIAVLLLFYKLKIAFWFFMAGMVIGFEEFFRSIFMYEGELGQSLAVLSLYIISSFSLGIGLIIQFIVILAKKK